MPENWTAIDPAVMARVSAANLPESVRDLAAQSGVSVDEYVKHISASTEIVVTGPREHGYASTVSVIPGPDGELPTIDAVRTGLQSAGATVTRVDNTATPIGPALVAQMRMTVGASIANQQVIVVKHGSRVAIVTAAAREWEAADGLVRSVMASLSEL